MEDPLKLFRRRNFMGGRRLTEQNEIQGRLESSLHPNFAPVGEGDGLQWLTVLLATLANGKDQGLQKLSHAFLSQCRQKDKVDGLVVELQVADSLINHFGIECVSANRKDGFASETCDITLLWRDTRVDIQCKAIRNSSNEVFIDDFLGWLNSEFKRLTPGLYVEIHCSINATRKTFNELKEFLKIPNNTPRIGEITFKKQIRLTFLAAPDDGIHYLATWSSTDSLDLPATINTETDGELLRKRIQDARRTFGFTPGPGQQNLVAFSAPGFWNLPKRQTLDALYGPKSLLLGKSGFEPVFEVPGVFRPEEPSYCSGMVRVAWEAPFSAYENVVYPVPKPRLHGERVLVSHPQLRGCPPPRFRRCRCIRVRQGQDLMP